MAADVGGISTTGADHLVQQPAQSKSLGRVSKQNSHTSEMADTCATAADITGADLTRHRSAHLTQYMRIIPIAQHPILDCHHFPPCPAAGSL